MKDFIETVAAFVFTLCFLMFIITLCAKCAMAWEILELKQFDMGYKSFFDGGRDPLITSNGLQNKTLGKELNLDMKMDFLDWFYWNNNVHGMTDRNTTGEGSQFRTVGWQFDFGIHLSQYLDFGYYHHSQHLLDTTYAHDGFPVQDALQIRLIIYKSKKESGGVFAW